MPLYEYRATEGGCEHCRDGFDVMHARSAPRPESCPECGAPVERLLGRVAVGKSKAQALKTLQNAGFTQYNRAGRGEYEKVSGDGPTTFGGD